MSQFVRILFALQALISMAAAQTATGTITGHVVDASGAIRRDVGVRAGK